QVMKSASALCEDCAGWTPWHTFATPVFIGASMKRPILYRKSKNWRNVMILLRRDCLVFKTAEGDFPLAAEQVTMDVIGDAIELLDEETIKHASEAVLHYFKVELGKTTVTVGEFTKMLERALNALGFTVLPAQLPIVSAPAPRTARVV